MAIKYSPGCGCCGPCFTNFEDITSAGGMSVYDQPMPTTHEWTAVFTPFSQDVSGEGPLIFGCDASGSGGYRVDANRTSSNDLFYHYTVELYDRTAGSVIATKEFELPAPFETVSEMSPNDILLNVEDCAGSASDVNVYIKVGASTGTENRLTLVKCFSTTVSGTRWGFAGTIDTGLGEVNLISAAQFGYIEPTLRDLTSALDLDEGGFCHICSIKLLAFTGETTTYCTDRTFSLTVSNFPAGDMTVPVGISGNAVYSNTLQNNGTYLFTEQCPMCLYKNELLEFKYTETFSGTTTNFLFLLELQHRLWNNLTAMQETTDGSDNLVTVLNPEPAFLQRYYTSNGDAVTTDPTKYYRSGQCQWTKPGDPLDAVPFRKAHFVCEYLP